MLYHSFLYVFIMPNKIFWLLLVTKYSICFANNRIMICFRFIYTPRLFRAHFSPTRNFGSYITTPSTIKINMRNKRITSFTIIGRKISYFCLSIFTMQTRQNIINPNPVSHNTNKTSNNQRRSKKLRRGNRARLH